MLRHRPDSRWVQRDQWRGSQQPCSRSSRSRRARRRQGRIANGRGSTPTRSTKPDLPRNCCAGSPTTERAGDRKPDRKHRSACNGSNPFQSWNNLGVLHARKGDMPQAVAVFKRSVSVKPDYTAGWFNLGAALDRTGAYVTSQRATAQAVRLDHSLRGAPLEIRSDTRAYLSDVDVSRPIPAHLRIGQEAQAPERAWSWVVLVIAMVRLTIALGLDKLVEAVGTRVLTKQWHKDRPWRRVWRVSNRFSR